MQHALSKDAAQSMDISAIVPFGEWYLHSRSAHRDPMVIEAYTQLQSETDRLFTMITRDGSPWAARVMFTRCGQPYETDAELIGSVRANGTLEITSAASVGTRLHPLLGCEFGGPFDRFRAVHDLIGHAWCGFGFDLLDECAAWCAQDRFHSGLARYALATEIFGVNAGRSILGETPDLRALLLAPSNCARLIDRPPVEESSRPIGIPAYCRLTSDTCEESEIPLRFRSAVCLFD
jgi:hypothetical protein